MRPHQGFEEKVADALSAYIDALADGHTPDVEEFLKAHAEVAERLRPLLFAAFATKRAVTTGPLAGAAAAPNGAVTDLARVRARRGVERGTLQMDVDQRPDVLLLLLRAVGQVWGKTRMQKLLFLVAKETDVSRVVPDFDQHYAYSFGPYSHVVNHDVMQLCDAGVVRLDVPRSAVPMDHRVDAVFELTDRGAQFADALARSPKGRRILEQLREIAAKYARMPLKELVKYVYTAYPEYAEKSKIRAEVLGKGGKDE